MADDLKMLRDQFEADVAEWKEPRDERATDLRYLAGDPWDPIDKQQRIDAGRPYLAFDELNQYVNQVVNDLRANPRAIAYAPAPEDGGDGAAAAQAAEQADKRAQLYADKTREIEYRSNAKQAYTLAAENAIQGAYGAVQVTSKYAPKSVRNQELWIEGFPDPDCVITDPFHRMPDGSDMQRAFVIEHRRIDAFKEEFPKAKVQSFEAYYTDKSYTAWVQPDRLLLANYWCIKTTLRRLLIVQPPAVIPPPGQMNLRPPVLPPPVEVWADEWKEARLPEGTTVLDEREADDPHVKTQLVNGVEILDETPWPGRYIPIIPCYGRVLYMADGGRTKRLLLSMIRLARDPYMAYCFYRTCEMENVGMTTKNPYWAYEGQVSAAQLTEIQKSLHEPVAVLFAKAVTDATGQQLLPLPQRNTSEPVIQALSVGAEETRRAIQAAIASNFLPTVAQRHNEKSGKALERIEQSSQKGTFHFIDHYEGMIRQTGVVIEDLFDKIYDTKRKIGVRKADDKTEAIWINDPGNPEAIDVKGRHAVTVSSGPDFDSTREAASDFADNLLNAEGLMQMLGPGKAAQVAALAVKLKVRENGIGAIGDQIVEIISPTQEQQLPPEVQGKFAEMQQQLQQLQRIAQEQQKFIETKQIEQQGKLAQTKEQNEGRMALEELKGWIALELQKLKGGQNMALQDDEQRHEVGLGEADAEEARASATMTALTGLAKPPGGGTSKPSGNGAGA